MRRGGRKEGGGGGGEDFICPCPGGGVVCHNDRTWSIVRSAAY